MLVKELVNDSIYKGTNQKIQTVLLWKTAIVKAINYALADIYTYEGKEWTFMYNKTLLERDPTDDKTIIIDLDKPIKKLVTLKHLKNWTNNQVLQPHQPPFPGPEYKIQITEPTVGVEDLKPDEVYFKPNTKQIFVPNNKNEWYILHWVSFFNPIGWDDEIPVPELFIWLLYNLTLTYLYPVNWQYWVDKEANNYSIAQTQLVNLAKTDAFQLNAIKWNIH